jgi:hypothetical protein
MELLLCLGSLDKIEESEGQKREYNPKLKKNVETRMCRRYDKRKSLKWTTESFCENIYFEIFSFL